MVVSRPLCMEFKVKGCGELNTLSSIRQRNAPKRKKRQTGIKKCPRRDAGGLNPVLGVHSNLSCSMCENTNK